MKLGLITVGQSPRDDVMHDMLPLLHPRTEILQAGALDELTLKQVQALEQPQGDDLVLVSRMRDGTPVRFAEKHVLPLLQHCIDRLEAQGAEQIAMLCTGEFPPVFRSRRPLIYPGPLVKNTAAALCAGRRLIILVPDELQLPQMKTKWASCAGEMTAMAVSPFAPPEEFIQTAERAKKLGAELAVMDCISYCEPSRRLVRDILGVPVLLSRSLLGRILAELE